MEKRPSYQPALGDDESDFYDATVVPDTSTPSHMNRPWPVQPNRRERRKAEAIARRRCREDRHA